MVTRNSDLQYLLQFYTVYCQCVTTFSEETRTISIID